MNDSHKKLTQTQELVLDMLKVKRNHSIPKTERRENVIEHTFSVTMLCWKLYYFIKPDLSLEKILKYALVHDFPERGQENDTNAYANQSERNAKEEREAREIKKLSEEFGDFKEMVEVVKNYDKLTDEEARFVWSVDKMQAMILGGMDGWRPYKSYGITYGQFCNKGDEFLSKCSPCLREVLQEVVSESCKTYYDQPEKS